MVSLQVSHYSFAIVNELDKPPLNKENIMGYHSEENLVILFGNFFQVI